MLVLSRRSRDAIMIGHDIVVTVLSISRDHVRIGIQAPANVEVHRQEVYLAIQEANRQASTSASGSLEGLSGVVPRRPGADGGPVQESEAESTRGTATP